MRKGEHEQVVGIGLALMDERIPDSGGELPDGIELFNFLKGRASKRNMGGIIPNIIDAYQRVLPPSRQVHLFSCVGRDERGDAYQAQTHYPLQRSSDQQTGVVVTTISEEGKIVRKRGLNAAAEEVQGKTEDLVAVPSLVISDIYSLRIPRIFTEAEKVFDHLKRNGRLFALNLGGALTSRDTAEGIRTLISALPQEPDIVIGNEDEIRYISGKGEATVLNDFSPNARLAVMTQGARGAQIRFEGEIFHNPVVPVTQVDEMGAGDAFCGTFLATLDMKPYQDWNKRDVQNAGYFAAHAGALVVTSSNSRLSQKDIIQLRVGTHLN